MKLESFNIHLFSVVLAVLSSTGLFAQSTSVTFNVNMNEQIALGKFDPDTEFTDLAGTFNNWGSTRLDDSDGDGIHSVSVTLNVGDAIEFKARINGEWNGREEFPGGGPNRSYTVEENGVVDFWYNDEKPDSALAASFEASSRLVVPGQVVQFFDGSNGSPVSWEWSFPGGTPSTSQEQNPIVTYATEGTYTVTLTISNDSGETESLTETDYIRVSNTLEAYWWNDAVFYEIFVRSFYDEDGDGKGDFKGLIEKLDYLNDGDPATHADLGITGIWLMPIHQSPSYHGYDVTDYRTIEADYGTNADFSAFIEAAHQRGINVIIDYVMNHSSSDHPWFIESKNEGSVYRDWYRWSDTNPGGLGPWGQTVWHNDGNDYYYGLFWGGMPDLNYETPAVKEEMFDIARFWLEDMQVDGFRLDAVKYIYETGNQLEDTEETFTFFRDFRLFYKSINPDAFAVGEAWTSTDKVKKYVENDRLDYCFEFDLAGALLNAANNGNASALTKQVEEVMVAYPYLQFGTFLTNHDQNRVMDVLGRDVTRAKLASQLLLSLPGIPYIYYGEEIGMVGSKPDEDIRTPLQWNGKANAGFTTGTPWRNPKPDYTDKNIEKQQQDYSSLWHTYKQMIQLRNNHPALRKGNYTTLSSDATSAAVFLRQFENEAIIVASNVSGTQINDLAVTLNFSTLDAGSYQLVDLLTGTVHDVEISGNGGFTNQGIGSLAARSTALYKLMAPGNLDTDITFMVDMSEMIANNKFDPTSESVDMVSNLNDWGTTLVPMEGPDENNIYSLVLPAQAIGSTISYKYRLNGVNDGNEEYAHSDFVRSYLVQEGNNDVLDVYQMDSPALGLADSATASFHAYPVPASGHVSIQLDSSIKGKASFTISDMSGKEVKGGMFKTSTDVSVDDLVSGIYILRVKVEGRSMSRKIIIENQ